MVRDSLPSATLFALALSFLLFGCHGDRAVGSSPPPSPTGTGAPSSEHPPNGVGVSVTVPAATSAETVAIRQAVSGVSALDAAAFQARYAVPHVASLGYDPTSAAGLDKISASSVAPSPAELGVLAKNGFVISEAHRFPTFTYGYETIYSGHLPLYVSADSILDAVHRSYDGILEQLESQVLVPELRTLLLDLRANLGQSSSIPASSGADVDFYLAVALSLLDGGSPAAPVAGANASEVSSFVAKATNAQGGEPLVLFGVARDVDLSQFTPRGHYTDSPELSSYFRAMMWIGRIDFRLIETQQDGSRIFYRQQFNAMLALASLFDSDNVDRHKAIDGAIQAFVGESDNMQVKDVGSLLSDLGAPARATTVDASDARVAQAILDGGYGAQRIANEIMINGVGGTLPLNRAFLVFGQRFTVDSNVFSNVVYDRVQGGAVMRMMPNPLDAAFAAFRNDQAGALLKGEIDRYHYASDLASIRVLVDSYPSDFWGQNLYSLWLSSIRALSPDGSTANPGAAGLPLITGTEAWGRRILNTQLSSWAELRHDTILYAKQSYTGGPTCEFPDAYVDPYPDFYAALKGFSDYAVSRVLPIAARAASPGLATSLSTYFQGLGTVAQTLTAMASAERTGTPFSADQMAFINEAVTIQQICGGGIPNGWYPKLVFGDALTFDPTVADVHTEPFDASGAAVGRVLHVGTGYARLMVVTANTCTGPRAYAGLAAAYFEQITENYDRLTDQRWKDQLNAATPPDVPWMTDLVVR